jgi:hypothetical protein
LLYFLSHATPDKERECLRRRRRIQNDGEENDTKAHSFFLKSKGKLP